jgi:hypothetical protein
MSETHVSLKSQLKRNLEQLQALRDEVRVKVHLAGMDLRDEWTKLEPRLADAEEKAIADISEASRHALTELIQKLEKLRSRLT